MRTLLVGLVGALLLLGGLALGAGGLALGIANPCSPSYQLAVQPAAAVEDPPEETRSLESLTAYQRTAVEAAVDDSRLTFGRREPLTRLVDEAIEVNGTRYVVTGVVEHPCPSIYDDLALAGFAAATVGGFLVLFALLAWRQQ